jgi:hypothetical protein
MSRHYTAVIGAPLLQRHGSKAASEALAQNLTQLLVGDGLTPEAAKGWVEKNIQRRGGYHGSLLVFDVPKPPGVQR